MEWVVTDHHIAIESGNEILHPNAEEVFSFVANDPNESQIPNPIDQLPELHFSKIGAPIKCELESYKEKIWLSIYALRKGKRCPVDVIEGKIIDHAVTDGEWFYINGDIESLQNKLNVAGILSCGEVNIGQYIDLIRQELFDDSKEIINKVDTELIKKMMLPVGTVPIGIKASLYNYQKTGYLWIKNMLQSTKGCILGDEMGLGKTLQIITLFQDLKDMERGPSLVIAPVSLLENWKRECSKFAPGLDTYIHHGSKRTGWASELKKHDVVIISYHTAVSDLSMLKMIKWQCVVLDEAQNIKNPESERAKSVKAITRLSGIAVTGTPFENHITDVWSLVDFCIPGLLGSLGVFQSNISDDLLGAAKLEPVLSPIMLRRLVNEVAKDLPDKILIPQPLVMSNEERIGYEVIRQKARDEVSGGSALTIALIQKLRMYCTHPLLCEEDAVWTDPYSASIKYQRFCEIVEEILSRNEKVIVFTSYRKMFDIFTRDIPARFGIEVKPINGDTPVDERQAVVDWFNEYKGSAMLALNPRAAGTGLNITGANHVIHYNLEWNPSLEDQASARSYRRGQEQTVFIHRLYYTDTVEQIVNERIEKKRDIASTLVIGTVGTDDKNDIMRVLEISPEFQ